MDSQISRTGLCIELFNKTDVLDKILKSPLYTNQCAHVQSKTSTKSHGKKK